jgi:hypothetical protein
VLTGRDLGGLTLTPGVYCIAASAQLTGALTLNALADPAAVFVFQTGSKLATASHSSGLFSNGGAGCELAPSGTGGGRNEVPEPFSGTLLLVAGIPGVGWMLVRRYRGV